MAYDDDALNEQLASLSEQNPEMTKLLNGIITQESSGNPNAIGYSVDGTRPSFGRTQLEEPTFNEVSKDLGWDGMSLADFRKNKLAQDVGGLHYANKMSKLFGGNAQGIAAYNLGQGNVGNILKNNPNANSDTNAFLAAMPKMVQNHVSQVYNKAGMALDGSDLPIKNGNIPIKNDNIPAENGNSKYDKAKKIKDLLDEYNSTIKASSPKMLMDTSKEKLENADEIASLNKQQDAFGSYAPTVPAYPKSDTFDPMTVSRKDEVENNLRKLVNYDAIQEKSVSPEIQKLLGLDTLLKPNVAKPSIPNDSYFNSVEDKMAQLKDDGDPSLDEENKPNEESIAAQNAAVAESEANKAPTEAPLSAMDKYQQLLGELTQARNKNLNTLNMAQAGDKIAQGIARMSGGVIDDNLAGIKELRENAQQPVKDLEMLTKNRQMMGLTPYQQKYLEMRDRALQQGDNRLELNKAQYGTTKEKINAKEAHAFSTALDTMSITKNKSIGRAAFTLDAANELISIKNSRPDGVYTKADVFEVAANANRMFTGGQNAAKGLIEELVPKTARNDIAGFLTWIKNNPEDTGAKAFAERYMHQADFQKKMATSTINSYMKSQTPAFYQLYRNEPEVYNNIISAKFKMTRDLNEVPEMTREQLQKRNDEFVVPNLPMNGVAPQGQQTSPQPTQQALTPTTLTDKEKALKLYNSPNVQPEVKLKLKQIYGF